MGARREEGRRGRHGPDLHAGLHPRGRPERQHQLLHHLRQRAAGLHLLGRPVGLLRQRPRRRRLLHGAQALLRRQQAGRRLRAGRRQLDHQQPQPRRRRLWRHPGSRPHPGHAQPTGQRQRRARRLRARRLGHHHRHARLGRAQLRLQQPAQAGRQLDRARRGTRPRQRGRRRLRRRAPLRRVEAARQLLQRQGLPRRGRQGHPRQGLRAPRDPRRQRRRRQARLHGRQREPAAAGPHGLHGGLRPDRQRRPDHLGLPAAQRLQPHHRPDLLHGLRQRQAHRPGHARRPHDAHPLLRGHSRRLALPGRVLVLGSHQQEPRQVRRERRSHRHAARHRRLQGQRERRRLQHQRPGHAGHHRDRRSRRGHPVRLAVVHVEDHRGLRRRAHHLVDVHRRLEGPDLRRDLRRRRRHGHHHQPHLPHLAEHVAFHHFYRHRGGRQRDARPASVLHARPARDRLRSPGRRVEQRHRQLQLVHVAQVHDRPGHRRSRLDPGQERHLPHRLQAAGLDHRQGRPGHLGGHRRRPQPRDLRRPDRRALHHHLRGGRSAAPDAVRRVGARRGHLQRGALPRRGHPQRRRHHLAGAARRGRPHLHHHPDRLQGRAAHRRGRRQGDHRLRRLPVAQGLRVLRGLLAAAERHAVRGVRHDHQRPGPCR